MLRVHPSAVTAHSYALDAAGRHHWRPVAPCARIEVALARPALRWRGEAYLDSNIGSAPLEDDFVRWDWMRTRLPDGRTAVLYDGQRRDGTPFGIAQAFAPDGTASAIAAPPRVALPPTGWRLAREARCDAGATPRVQQSLEDGPFYARGLLATQLQGQPVLAVHESLSLDRFRARWVQALLPFRMRGLRRAALQRLGLGKHPGRQP
jgi:carotenoid 1,2-hydratase